MGATNDRKIEGKNAVLLDLGEAGGEVPISRVGILGISLGDRLVLSQDTSTVDSVLLHWLIVLIREGERRDKVGMLIIRLWLGDDVFFC
jgi:hypothetical protein